MSELKIVDLNSFLFSFSFSFPFKNVLFLSLKLGVNVILHITVAYLSQFYGHMITCHIEHCKRFWNDNVIPYINSM